MTKTDPIRLILAITVAAMALAGCQTLPTLPGGGFSGMTDDNTRLRSQLVIAPVPLPGPPVYGPVQGCSYRVSGIDADGRRFEVEQNTSIRRVRDRLLITVVAGRNTSTALIGPTGELFDFNMPRSDGARTTRENFGQVQQGKPAAPVINRFTLAFPHYIRPRLEVGQFVAFVIHESGWPWANYVYRGTTNYNGVEAIVLDLEGLAEDGSRLTIGFSIIDRQRAIPFIYAVDGGLGYRVEQIHCQ